MLINSTIFKKEIDSEIKWVYQEEHYDGFGDFTYTKDYLFDTYYDAEHESRIRSGNEKYTSNFTRTFDKYGKETYKDEDVIFKIITPSSEQYWRYFNCNRELDKRIMQYNKSFWKKLFRLFYKPPKEDYYELPKTKVEMKIEQNKHIIIFEGKDWGEAKKFISEFVKAKSIFFIKNGNILSD